MMKFIKGDKVLVTAGKDKGREAQVEFVLADKQSVVLPGINIYKKHIKAAFAADKKGGIYEIPRPLNFAKVAVICPACGKPTRIGFRKEGDKMTRFCKKCDKSITQEVKKTK